MQFIRKSFFIVIVFSMALITIGYFVSKILPIAFVAIIVAILIIALFFRYLKDKNKILKS
ncbi:MAG: hypothetical protein HY831_00285 [Candidatus Aenigmarchaeota archaeon]|nr:hypothetical protein [Candidatus Aenigmarchaeota archaeon]